MHAFFALFLKSKIIMRNVRNRGFKLCGNTEQSNVLSCVFREVRDAVEVWIVKSDIVELILGQVAKLLGDRAEVRLTRAFGSGKLGKKVMNIKVGKGLQVTDREQQGRVKHESGEGEMESKDMRVHQTFSGT